MESCVTGERTLILKKEYKTPGGRDAMVVNMALPVLTGTEKLVRASKRYYGGVFGGFLKFCEKKVLPRALRDGDDAPPRGCVMKYTVTFEDISFLSVAVDCHLFDGKSRGKTVRLTQVWLKDMGRLAVFGDFFRPADRERLIAAFLAEAAARAEKGASYREGFANLIDAYADFSRFYLTNYGFAFCFAAGELSDSRNPEVFTVTREHILR